MAKVKLDEVRKVYANGHVAVEGASFDVADGELLVLVGPSGCGKSTLLRMIAGLESISAGTLAIGERVVNDVAPRDRDIAMVFQNYALYPHMTVGENLGFGLRLRGESRADVDRRVNEAAEMLDLRAVLDRRPAELSGGQRQRVALGRALVRKPAVFLLDEPLSNLDAKLRLSTRVEIAKLHRRLGATMIYVTHDQIEAMTLGHRIVVLEGGRVQQIDTPMGLYERPANVFVAGFLGSPAMNFFEAKIAGDVLSIASASAPVALRDVYDSRALAELVGRDLLVGLRPEDLRVVDSDEVSRGPTLVGELDVVEPVGNEVFLNLRVGERAVVARVPPQRVPRAGDTLALTFDAARLHVFDAKSGTRIARAAERG